MATLPNNALTPTKGLLPTSTALGAKASSPQGKVTPPVNTLTSGQTAPPSTSTAPKGTGSNTGAVGAPEALRSYPEAVRAYQNYDPSKDPQVLEAQNRERDFENSYADVQAGHSTQANPFGYQSNLMGIAGARHAALAPTYTAQVSQAQTGAQQKQAGLAGAAGLSAPVQVNPGNFYVSPTSGKDITGGDIDPFKGGQRQGMVSQGAQYQSNLPIISTAKALSGNLSGLIQQAGLNSNDLNAANWLQNVYASNTSNPVLPQIQSQFNNIITQYAKVLGVDPGTLITSLTSTSRGQTINDLLANLDQQARTYNNNLANPNAGVAPGGATPPAAAKIRVKIGNTTGTIDPAEFDPKTMTKI